MQHGDSQSMVLLWLFNSFDHLDIKEFEGKILPYITSGASHFFMSNILQK